MKTILNPLFAILALCAFATGCQSAPPLLTKSQDVVTVTNQVRVVETVTNEVGVPLLITNVVEIPRLVTNDVYTVSPEATSYVRTAQGAAATVGTMYPPAAPVVGVVDAVLGLALLGLGLFAKIKTNLARKNADALDKTTDMLTAVISGVEVANSPGVKLAISEHASTLGVTQALDSVVQAVTSNLPTRKT